MTRNLDNINHSIDRCTIEIDNYQSLVDKYRKEKSPSLVKYFTERKGLYLRKRREYDNEKKMFLRRR